MNMKFTDEINVVHLHVRYKTYYTGIDRYLEMYSIGIKSECYSNIRVHKIYVTNDNEIIFPQITYMPDGTLSAVIPMVYDNSLLSLDGFWRRRCMKVIVDMVKPYLRGLPNLVFQCHYLYLSVLADEFKKELGGKIITHLHCLPWKFSYNRDEKHYNEMYRLYESREYDQFNKEESATVDYAPSDKIICLSEAAKNYLVNTKMIPCDKIEIIMNGLAQTVGSVGLRNGPIKILYVGKVSKDKGCFKMLDILDVVRKRGYDFEVIIAGTVGDADKNRICNIYKQLRLTFLKQIPYSELVDLYRTCTLGIIPSIHEQCSYVAIEMSMFGVPMVVSEVDALKEMFKDKETALMVPLLFDPDLGVDFDKKVFVRSIIELIENEDLREYLGANAKKAYRERFSLDVMMKCTVDLYKRIV